MKISTRGRYATCALITLAEQYGEGQPVSLKKISTEQKISMKYLENIMRLLIKTGIVTTLKGKTGGFMLAMHPDRIIMGDVVSAAEGVVIPVHCVEDSSKCPRVMTCPAKYMWREMQESVFSKLNSKTLGDLVRHKKQLAEENARSEAANTKKNRK